MGFSLNITNPAPLVDVSSVSKLWQAAENYFDWKGANSRAITIINKKSSERGKIEFETCKTKNSLALTILKIISLPFVGLFFLGVKTYYRMQYHFVASKQSSSIKIPPATIEKAKTTSQTIISKTKDSSTSAKSESNSSAETILPAAPETVAPQKKAPSTSVPQPPAPTIQEIIEKTPEFNGYKIMTEPHIDITLTGVNVRPANLFFQALFNDMRITTLPGSNELFRFKKDHKEIRKILDDRATKDPNGVVAFTAKCQEARGIRENGKKCTFKNLNFVYGNNVYKMSNKEVVDTLNSQKIYTASILPVQFYTVLKAFMKADNIVTLPGTDDEPLLLKEFFRNPLYPNLSRFLAYAYQNPETFGFKDLQHLLLIYNMTLYQLGSLVVKSEDYRIFIDGNGKMLAREPGQNDAIRLINACGIRGITADKTNPTNNSGIMREGFKAAFQAAEKGIVIFPAVGMGVWRGAPEVYWPAFLYAVIACGDSFETIMVNPNHQASAYGEFQGSKGEEFQLFLDLYIKRLEEKKDVKGLANLRKIKNLKETGKDVVQLAHKLKVAYPDKIISLFNASDPDVTLGNHVGEYVNNWPHIITTEENYTAMGTNGLCFEGITGVHDDLSRIFQVKIDGTLQSLASLQPPVPAKKPEDSSSAQPANGTKAQPANGANAQPANGTKVQPANTSKTQPANTGKTLPTSSNNNTPPSSNTQPKSGSLKKPLTGSFKTLNQSSKK